MCSSAGSSCAGTRRTGTTIEYRLRLHAVPLRWHALPFGPLGRLAHGALVRRDLERIFDFRAPAVERALNPQPLPGR